jgi:hypothetical protein
MGTRGLARRAKQLRQLPRRRGAARACFVVGAPHSGTPLLLACLDAHRDTLVFHEGDAAAYDDAFRLHPVARRRRLVERARCAWVVWQPLLDFQHLDALLAVHPGARAIFVVRDPRDAARSSVEEEGNAMQRLMRRLASRDPGAHWLAERLPEERHETLRKLARANLDPHSCAALCWWLRNELFFDLALDTRHDEVLPVRYEALVQAPDEALADVFAFLGLSHAERAVRLTAADRGGRGRNVALDPAVAQRCRALETRLDAVIAARRPS